jgi:tripartite-type tricarboxylate transporter receptor subunit TctC
MGRLTIYNPNISIRVEIGFSNAFKGSWPGLVVRPGTLQIIVEKLDEAFKEALKNQEFMNIFE